MTASTVFGYFWACQHFTASGSAALIAVVLWILLFFCIVTTAVARNLPEIQHNCEKFIPATMQRACPAAATNDAVESE